MSLNSVDVYQNGWIQGIQSRIFFKLAPVQEESNKNLVKRWRIESDATATLEATRSLSILLMSRYPRIPGVEFVIIQQDTPALRIYVYVGRVMDSRTRPRTRTKPAPSLWIYKLCSRPFLHYQPVWSTFEFAQYAQHILLRRPIVHTQNHHIPGKTPNGQTLSSTTGCHPFQRTNPKALGGSSSPPSTEMSDITVFELDSSYLYQCSHYSSFIV
ncbi:hypothetical protein C8R48DRAFT_807743 [Suillus tomentosus]|nr:hypothetical protein C8R48DRAFT_807743 [Suillus tomentosus]